MSGVNEIRSSFLDFFARNGHEIVSSGPLVPRNDPTLMFTNAGMVQFKNVFTGLETRPYDRAVTSQKCVRAGGKHNDLDNVGYTARHHTFFEMLGNFSFGDYFKERAIELAWTLVTKEFGLPAHRLLVTVFAEDDDAFNLWKKIAGLSDDRIIRIATSDNFWAMGETGPCGPCSEIFYDHGEDIPGGPPGSPDEDGDRFIEIWNLVFMQFEQVTKDERVSLPRPSIDTGMGLERIAAVLQGVHNNYDIDLFKALIGASEDATGVPAAGEHLASHRVIADHLRATSFLIADGVLPSNEGRGYVLRRIMRRAMRHAHLLGARDPLLYKLVPTLVREMGRAFPELTRAEALVTETLKLEETRFRRTLSRGLGLLEEATADMGEGATLDGGTAFKLYDTFGFPLDLTEDALRPRGIAVDTDAFKEAMARQKAEARAAWAGSGEAATETVWFSLREDLGATEFLGYDSMKAEGVVAALIADGAPVDALEKGAEGAIILNQTPFYAESGGQVGDIGVLVGPAGRFKVTDVAKKADGLHVHMGVVEEGKIEKGAAVEAVVDAERRAAIRSNHSATHLLHAALRTILGDHVTQKGSLVAPDRLRFDFAHPKPVNDDEAEAIEEMVNTVVLQNAPVSTRLMAVDEAIESGAMALFGEKYGDEVRVVTMGDGLTDPAKPYSVELCGGTHVSRTGDIGLFTLVSEGAVAAGVRRIEALTGAAARRYLEGHDAALQDIAALLKVTPNQALERTKNLVEERRKLEKELAEARKKLALGGGAANTDQPIRDLGKVKLLARAVSGISPKDLKGLVDDGKKSVGSGVVVVVGVTDEGKAGIVVGVTEDLAGAYNAVDLVRIGSQELGGKGGGGRPDMAQAGGPDGSRAEAAIEAIEAALSAA
ncbi:alanine--tRNA ligase [Rhodobium gokarnense]|uniref:Alanine--tRNA ligase n=1 Tax=Rhodobium gokarnense TaxID=364296 RepID=A0ABT3HD94_9HYPH|nr:alanine--tRNA ligase [Rhodobium gokarnense]MCW2308350.1 alanyl-tRNA synthetase [Rhodobium gokarnense]